MSQSKRVSNEDHNAARDVVAELVTAKLRVAEQDKVLVQELAELCDSDRVIMLCLDTAQPSRTPIRVVRHAEKGFTIERERESWLEFLRTRAPTEEPVIAVACAIKETLFAASILDHIPRDMFERGISLADERGLGGIRDLIGCGWRYSPSSPRMTGVALHRLDKRPFGASSLRRL